MRIEQIKVGDVFTYRGDEVTVISKSDEYRVITTIDSDMMTSTLIEIELHFLKPIKEQLPEEGLLVSIAGSLVYKLSDGSGYGFSIGRQSEYYFNKGWGFSSSPNGYWRKATEQEENKFVEMLKKECEKRGLYEDTKIERYANGNVNRLINSGQWNMKNDMCNIYNKNGQIFELGKFATPRKEEETTLTQVSKAVQEIGDFTIEQTESGVIILTPIKR